MLQLVERVLADERTITAIATIDGKQQEPAIVAAAARLSVPIFTFSAARLNEETPRLANPSEVVFRETGCHGVAEASALAAAGTHGHLLVEKQVFDGCTAALAFAPQTAED